MPYARISAKLAYQSREKNGKTATVAALCLAYLVGPLNRDELRIIAGSLSLEHVGELQTAIRQTAEASERWKSKY